MLKLPATTANPAHVLPRLALVSLAVAVGLAAAGWLPTAALGGAEATNAMLFGIGVALIGGWAGLSVPVALLRHPPQAFAWGAIGGLGARFLVTLTLALVLRQSGTLAIKPFLIWVGLAQFVILAVDMLGLVRLVRTLRPAETA